MLKNAYLLADIGADTAENEQNCAGNLTKIWQKKSEKIGKYVSAGFSSGSLESAAFTAKNWRISCSPFRSIDQDINMWCPFLASLAALGNQIDHTQQCIQMCFKQKRMRTLVSCLVSVSFEVPPLYPIAHLQKKSASL